MYIVNPENIPKKISVCGVIANYLIEEKKVPLLGKSEDGNQWYFADTFRVNLCLKEMPFWMKLARFY